MTIRFVLVKDDLDPAHCTAQTIIATLFSTGRLNQWKAAIGPDKIYGGMGNCHEACFALLADLTTAGQQAGWKWATAETQRCGKHSWLEYDGWAIDCGRGDVVLFWQAAEFRKQIKLRSAVKLRNADQTARYIMKEIAQGKAGYG